MLRKRGLNVRLPTTLKIVLTVLAISFSTFFFLPRSISELSRLTWNLLSASHFSEGRLFQNVGLSSSDAAIAAVAFAFVVAFETWQRRFNAASKPASIRVSVFLFVAALLVMATIAAGVGDSKAFFYLRF